MRLRGGVVSEAPCAGPRLLGKVLTGRLSRCPIDGRSAPDHTRLVRLSDRLDWAPARQGNHSHPIRAAAGLSNRRPRPADRDPLTSRLADFIRSGTSCGKRCPSFRKLSTWMIRPSTEGAERISPPGNRLPETEKRKCTCQYAHDRSMDRRTQPGSFAYIGTDDEPTTRASWAVDHARDQKAVLGIQLDRLNSRKHHVRSVCENLFFPPTGIEPQSPFISVDDARQRAAPGPDQLTTKAPEA